MDRPALHPIIEQDVEGIVDRVGAALDGLEGRTVLITGALGLLPSYLAETVAQLNEHRFHTPCRLIGIVRRLPDRFHPHFPLVNRPGIELLEGDARNVPADLDPIDYMVLAATKGSPTHYLADPIGTLQLNGSGLEKWLEAAARMQCRGVLYFSSGEIYGTPDPDAVPTPETYAGRIDPADPRSVYAESKRFGEALCLAYARMRGVPVKIVRPFQVFGPGIAPDDGRAMPDFLWAAAKGKPIVLRSAGKALRTFMYVADATTAFWQVLFKGRPKSVYNVGTSSPEVTILELAKTITRLADNECEVRVDDANTSAGAGSPQRTCPDVSRLESDFGFQPAYSLDDLISRTLAWLKSDGLP